MEIKFRNKKLKELCKDTKSANQELGLKCAKKLRTRIAEILAADVVTDLPAGRPHPLKGKRMGQYALDLSDGKRLIFTPANNPTPMNDNSIDWSRVTKVCIIEIVDYHD